MSTVPEFLMQTIHSRHLQGSIPTMAPTYFIDGTTNSASKSTTIGLIYTFVISVVMFIMIVIFFEFNRFYKQIFLKRYQKRFVEAGRIPPEPPNHAFGWLYATMRVEEIDVLYMVGLDAYMLLRYHVVCLKLCIMLSVCSLAILLPAYGTVNTTYRQWDKFTLPNILASNSQSERDRIWLAVLFGYAFSAYFCQLLYNEYNNFSNERLRCLQANHDGQVNDTTDNLPQKYYTIMLERIPPDLRSAEKLYDYFNELFPGDVYTIEVSLDLRELNAMINKRKYVRNKLEKAVANYIATRKRPLAIVRKGKYKCFPEGVSHAITHFPWFCGCGEQSCTEYLGRFCTLARYGLVKLDAINYYTEKLIDLNVKTRELQAKCFEISENMKLEMNKKIKNGYDSRAAAAVEQIGLAGNKIMKKVNTTGIESIFFDESAKKKRRNSKTPGLSNKRHVDNNPNYSSKHLSHANLSKSQSSDHLMSKVSNQMGQKNHSDSNLSTADSSDDSNSNTNSNSNTLTKRPSSDDFALNVDDSYDSLQSIGETKDYIISSIESNNYAPFTLENDKEKNVIRSLDQEVENPMHHNQRSHHPDGISVSVDNSNSNNDNNNNDNNTISVKQKKLSTKSIKSFVRGTKVKQPKIILDPRAREVVNRAKNVGQHGFEQAKIAGVGAMRSGLELERLVEMLTVGAYYKYSSTAFVTFKSRMAETIAQQMVLSNDAIEISHAPNPHDIIWENVAIPKPQVITRNNITNVGLVIGSVFWSSLVTVINRFAKSFTLVEQQQNFISVGVILMFLLVLPFIFDTIARYYEGFKLESEIQDTIMTRYFYYQLVNIYVTIGLGRVQLDSQITYLFRNPQLFIDLLGKTIPSLSLYFTDLVIVKLFVAIPLEMCRPWQLSTILLLGTVLDRKKLTRRELRSGAFFAWPMLYGWVYPQLLLVTMIMLTYACIAPLLMPFGVLFFVVSYIMYKYQLLYVYVNDNQSLGFMWYAVFNRSLIALIFATFTLLACLAVNANTIGSAPFFLTLPLPAGIFYFWHYCEILKKNSLDLSFGFAKKIDHRNDERKEKRKPIPLDTFKKDLYRQPTLTESEQFPEPYRKIGDTASDILSEHPRRSTLVHRDSIGSSSNSNSNANTNSINEGNEPGSPRGESLGGFRLRSQSINVHTVEDEVEDTKEMLEKYFQLIILRRLCTNKTLAEKFVQSRGSILPITTQPNSSSPASNHIDHSLPLESIPEQGHDPIAEELQLEFEQQMQMDFGADYTAISILDSNDTEKTQDTEITKSKAEESQPAIIEVNDKGEL